jgi:hypothetical protein
LIFKERVNLTSTEGNIIPIEKVKLTVEGEEISFELPSDVAERLDIGSEDEILIYPKTIDGHTVLMIEKNNSNLLHAY